jgi:hypothetical protein
VSVSAVLYPRWPPLQKIEISSNGQNCSILSKKVPKYMLKSSSLCLYSSNLGTFWLKIEQFWPFEEISIFSIGGHLGYRTALTDTILMLSLNCKNVQHVKIYLPCNFEVNFHYSF